ncbi:hypothetical protein EK21DRAFT_93568 [Setomelanomma holmii]|uniref:Polynucleotide 5'-hydroxyl-kinase GRC3 n=1 Tax=Setomelanomma holmii TaxID=210430 RepID=A0A9P4LHB3_9PLEO|nr:hypothetical protein EK21DRAFT_93568 [Setomelanomma holmii]
MTLTTFIDPTANASKPLSAIAAARLRADATSKDVVTPEITVDQVPQHPQPLQQVSTPELDASVSDDEPLAVQRNIKLCTWRNDPQNVLSDDESGLKVNLSKHTTISLIGSFQFKVLRGAINVNGANIGVLSRRGRQDEVYTACVPATHPITKLRGLDGVNHVHIMDWDRPVALARFSPLFADIWNVPAETGFERSFTVIQESSADPLARPLTPEVASEDWLRVVEECSANPSAILIVGSSDSGKSTFARRLLNRYLTGQGKSARPVAAVCYLDLDPAKPEYTSHGQVSLSVVRTLNLGPSYTHSSVPPLSMDVERTTTMRSHPVPMNLVNYLEYLRVCAEDLFLTYKSLQSRESPLPLIVNTSGSLYETDFNLLANVLASFKPHHLVHLGDVRANGPENDHRLHTLQSIVSQYRGTTHAIASQSPSSPRWRTEAELRAMQMQSYFSLRNIETNDGDASIWSGTSLSNIVPWEFSFQETDERTQDFVGFFVYSEPIEPASLVDALNGSIIQIVESTSSAIPTPYTSLPRTKRYRIPHFPKSERTGMMESLDPKTSKLICTALVRGFDPARKVVQLLVPRTHECLLHTLTPERTVFVGGCCGYPDWAFVEQAHLAEAGELGSDGIAPSTTWVEEQLLVEDMGYLNTVRRVRKFQT